MILPVDPNCASFEPQGMSIPVAGFDGYAQPYSVNTKPSKTIPNMKRLCGAILFALAISGLGQQAAFANDSKSMKKDSSVKTSHEFKLPAAAVWDLIAGFDTLPDYHLSVPKSRLSKGGAVRHLTISEEAGGGTVVERLVNYDDEAMTFSYRIIKLIDSPMPFRNYQAWVKLESTGKNSCKLQWNSSFNVEGTSKEEAEELARVIYQGCYDGITRVLAK
jgi:hypothetical protein